MSVRMRHTKGHRNNRRSHHGLDEVRTTTCAKCGAVARPHHACANCGTYKGREVVDVLAKLTKKEQKAKAKELAEQEEDKQSSAGLDAAALSQK